MSTHNICFRGEIRNILCGYPLLSVAMFQWRFYEYQQHMLPASEIQLDACPAGEQEVVGSGWQHWIMKYFL